MHSDFVVGIGLDTVVAEDASNFDLSEEQLRWDLQGDRFANLRPDLNATFVGVIVAY